MKQANELKNNFTDEVFASVNYVCVFAQSKAEYESLSEEAAHGLGQVVKQMPNGLLFALARFETVFDALPLLKIRQPDATRPDRGDADFTLIDYSGFKKRYLGQPGFKLIVRPEMEMVELCSSQVWCKGLFFTSTAYRGSRTRLEEGNKRICPIL